jgi:hypothetical protein
VIAARAGQAAWAMAIACAAALLLAGPRPAGADDNPSLPTPHGLVWLSLPQVRRPGPQPVVLILADRTGPDGREVPYVDYLLAAGIAVLQLGSDAPEEAAPLLALQLLLPVRTISARGLRVLGAGVGPSCRRNRWRCDCLW